MLFRQILLACLIWLTVACSVHARVIVIAHPANPEDVQQILRITKLDQLILSSIRRDVENNNKKEPTSFVDVDIYMQPFTLEAINERTSKTLAHYMSSDYAQKLLKDLNMSAAKNSFRLEDMERSQGIDAVRVEFRKLPPSEQKAVNEFRSSASYLSLINGLTNSKDERTAMFRQWSSDEMQARVRQSRKVIAELLDTNLKLAKEEIDQNAVSLPNRIPRTGIRSFDQESRISFEYLRANLKQNQQFMEELKSVDFAKVLNPENLVTRSGLEEGNLILLTAENIFDNNTKRHESLRNTYNAALENIVMTPQQRQELLADNNKSMARIVDVRIRHNEHLRNMLELEKQILNLCENRFGKIKLEGKTLMFDSQEDLNQYNALLKQAVQANQEMQNVEKDDLEYRTQSVERFKKK